MTLSLALIIGALCYVAGMFTACLAWAIVANEPPINDTPDWDDEPTDTTLFVVPAPGVGVMPTWIDSAQYVAPFDYGTHLQSVQPAVDMTKRQHPYVGLGDK